MITKADAIDAMRDVVLTSKDQETRRDAALLLVELEGWTLETLEQRARERGLPWPAR
jgi:hypothetical protein